jgi:hypothetical protein
MFQLMKKKKKKNRRELQRKTGTWKAHSALSRQLAPDKLSKFGPTCSSATTSPHAPRYFANGHPLSLGNN